MRIFNGFDGVEVIKNPVVTMGSYDGVHCGHRKILDTIKSKAQDINGESVVITFDPHPRKIIFPDEKLDLLNTLDEKIFLLSSVGIDNLIIIPFNEQFRVTSSEYFATTYLFNKLHTKVLVIGYNHHFGNNRRGGFDYLEPLQKEYNFELCQISKLDVDHEKVSSTIVRSLVASGNISLANKQLGAPYFIFSTINSRGIVALESEDKLIPVAGIYNISITGSNIAISAKLTINNTRQLSVDPSVASFDGATTYKIEFIE